MIKQILVYTEYYRNFIRDKDGKVYLTNRYQFVWEGERKKLKETFPDFRVDTKPVHGVEEKREKSE